MNAVTRDHESTNVAELHNNPFGSKVVARPTGAMTEALVQREIAEVQAMAVMAKRFPRDPIVAMDRILQACTRPTLAEVAVYEYARGGSSVSGPSIRMAEAIAQNWGNILCGVDIVASDEKKSECVAYAWDLETNAREQKRFTVRHWRDTKKGGYPLTDERDIYELCANLGARRKRACILAVIPGDVVEAAVEQCEITLKTNVEITPEYIQTLTNAFEKFGVTTAMIEKVIQRRIDTLTSALAMRLKKIYASLKDGMSEPKDWFEMEPAPDTGAGSAEGGTRTDQVKAALRPKAKTKGNGFEDPPAAQAATGNAPGAITDEVAALRDIDAATSEETAALVLDQCRGQPFYGRAVDAFNKRWSETIK